MKLINYRYGPVMPSESTWYDGKVVMTEIEWSEARAYLLRATKDGFTRELLKKDIRNYHAVEKGRVLAIRVPLIAKLVARYSLKGYKRANYFILITK